MIWITFSLTITLYFLLSSQTLKEKKTAAVGVVALYFIPTILMVLCYVLIYQQVAMLMVKSRIG